MDIFTLAITQFISWLGGIIGHDPTLYIMSALTIVVWTTHFVLRREINRMTAPVQVQKRRAYPESEK